MDYLPQLAQQGLLGLIAAIEGMALYFLYRENKTLQDKRITDLQQSRDNTEALIAGVKQTGDLILTVVQSGRGRSRS